MISGCSQAVYGTIANQDRKASGRERLRQTRSSGTRARRAIRTKSQKTCFNRISPGQAAANFCYCEVLPRTPRSPLQVDKVATVPEQHRSLAKMGMERQTAMLSEHPAKPEKLPDLAEIFPVDSVQVQ